jgi:hypothetical protein
VVFQTYRWLATKKENLRLSASMQLKKVSIQTTKQTSTQAIKYFKEYLAFIALVGGFPDIQTVSNEKRKLARVCVNATEKGVHSNKHNL